MNFLFKLIIQSDGTAAYHFITEKLKPLEIPEAHPVKLYTLFKKMLIVVSQMHRNNVLHLDIVPVYYSIVHYIILCPIILIRSRTTSWKTNMVV